MNFTYFKRHYRILYYKLSKIGIRLRILLFAGLMVSASVGAAEPDTLVVLFGDSITAGINVPNGFVNGIGGGATEFAPPDINLNQILKESRRPTVLVNWGHGGTTSGPSEFSGNDGTGRIQANLLSSKSQFPATQNIVLIMYGTNDYSQQLSSSDTLYFVREMINKARAAGFTPVVATIPDRVGEEETIPGRNFQIKSAANLEGAPVVDVYQALENEGGISLLYDGIHPSLEGYQIIAQAWFDNYLSVAIEQQAPTIAQLFLCC